jgi:hypothetical protein
MQLVQTNIREIGGEMPAYKVEFCGADGEVITLHMRQSDAITSENIITRAKALIATLAEAEGQSRGDGENAYQNTYDALSNGDFDR